MEEKIDGAAAEVQAQREVEDAIHGDRATAEELESKFARLEGRDSGSGGADAKNPELDDEIAALKKKIRIG